MTLGEIEVELIGGEGEIEGWALSGERHGALDGLATVSAGAARATRPEPATAHPNGALAIDHLVVFTPDLNRTTTAMEGIGFELRRVREATEPGPDVRQAFFRPDGAIVEVVENAHAADGPARFWGLTVAVRDLDHCTRMLGSRLGEAREAVQPGRRIATFRREAALGVPVALISPHPGSLRGEGTPAATA